jgi:hypothetical protein
MYPFVFQGSSVHGRLTTPYPAFGFLISAAAGPSSFVGNDSGKGVTWWVVPITLAIAAALAWAMTYLEQTGRIKLN